MLSDSPSLENLAECTDRKSTRLNSSHRTISYAVFCLKKKKDADSRSRCSPSPHLCTAASESPASPLSPAQGRVVLAPIRAPRPPDRSLCAAHLLPRSS